VEDSPSVSADGTTFDSINAEDEVGLRTPDGSIIWPPDLVQGYSLETEQGRQSLIAALREHAESLHIPADQLLANYLWVIRKRITITVSQLIGVFPITELGPSADDADTVN